MKSKDKKGKKEITSLQKKGIWSLFILLTPSLILAIMLTFPRQIEFIFVGLILFFYQAILLKNFIEKDYQDY